LHPIGLAGNSPIGASVVAQLDYWGKGWRSSGAVPLPAKCPEMGQRPDASEGGACARRGQTTQWHGGKASADQGDPLLRPAFARTIEPILCSNTRGHIYEPDNVLRICVARAFRSCPGSGVARGAAFDISPEGYQRTTAGRLIWGSPLICAMYLGPIKRHDRDPRKETSGFDERDVGIALALIALIVWRQRLSLAGELATGTQEELRAHYQHCKARVSCKAAIDKGSAVSRNNASPRHFRNSQKCLTDTATSSLRWRFERTPRGLSGAGSAAIAARMAR
jgi:hypothetical protein